MVVIRRTPLMLMVAALTALSPQFFPGGGHGIGFDDLNFDPTLREVMVPGGNTGKLELIDPDSQKVDIIGGFSERAGYSGGHGEGITSADVGHGLVFVTDRSARLLDVVDPQAKKIVATVRLASGPDYVRFVPDTNEVWVTEPSAERIEVFTLIGQGPPGLTHTGFIAVPGGPESIAIGQAFTPCGEGLRSPSTSGTARSSADGSMAAKDLAVSRLTKNAAFSLPGATRGKLTCSI